MEKTTVLIDGSNLCHRVFWANMNLSYNENPVGAIYGFFKSFVFLKQKYPCADFIVAWDRKSVRRKVIAAEAIEKGLIERDYKENRKERYEEQKDKFESLYEQMDRIREGLVFSNCLSLHVDHEEADDIIYSYCKNIEGKKVIVSSDNDFYQCLEDENVIIFDAMKKQTWNKEIFELEFGFKPELWVDAGAIIGDKSDEIKGLNGWGKKTTFKYVCEYGTIENITRALKEKLKKSKSEENFLSNTELLSYAKRLKQMYVIDNLPTFNGEKKSILDLKQFFLNFGFASLLKDLALLTQ